MEQIDGTPLFYLSDREIEHLDRIELSKESIDEAQNLFKREPLGFTTFAATDGKNFLALCRSLNMGFYSDEDCLIPVPMSVACHFPLQHNGHEYGESDAIRIVLRWAINKTKHAKMLSAMAARQRAVAAPAASLPLPAPF